MTDAPALLVTGAARRLGRAIALRFAQEGWDVAIHYNGSGEEAEAFRDDLRAMGRRAELFQADLMDLGACAPLVAAARAAFPRLKGLVNSASVFERDTLEEMTEGFYREQMRVNAEAPVFLTQAFWKTADAPGWALNMIDCKVFQLTPDFFSYTLSKLALLDATRMLAMACAPGLRVNGIAPGLILPSGGQTEEQFHAMHDRNPLRKGPSEAEITDAALMLAQSPSVTGQVLTVDGGRHFYTPRSLRDLQ